MPFYIYEKEDKGDYWRFRNIKQITAIPRKLIQPFFSDLPENFDEDSLKWKMYESDIESRLLDYVTPSSDKQLSIVIDLKPNSKKNEVSLYQIKAMYGCSYEEWTPLCLKLGAVCEKSNVEKPYEVKQIVEVRKSQLDQDIIEFLYIMKGYKSGSLNWGRTGNVNAVLLWPEALKYFIKECLKI